MEEKKFDKDINVRSKDNTKNNVGMTDDEIVKAYKYCVLDKGGCNNCPYEDWGCGIDENALIDLIHRLQGDYSNLKERYVKVLGLNEKVIAEQKAEIERLTEENGYLKQCADTFLEDCKRERKQAVKDTAKEILQTIKRAKENGQMYYGEAFMITAQKAYGVEVE